VQEAVRSKTKLVKTLRYLLLFLLLGHPLFAKENPYDLLGRALMPFVSVLAEHAATPNRALLLSVRLEQMTDLPAEFAGAHADLALQYPDKLRLHAPIQGEDLTICRNGQEVWIYPGSRASALLQKLEAEHKLPKPDPKFRLAPFRLPVPEKQLVFLPALFQVEDAGQEVIDGETCRVLGLQLNPTLARSLEVETWSARLTLHADARPVRLTLRNQAEWSGSVRFDTVKFQPSLPPETWQPSADQAADVTKIPPLRYNQFLRALFGGK